MVNTITQTPVTLEGRGFVARDSGNYQPGEYKALSNVEIKDGILENRRSLKSTYGNAVGTAVTPMTNSFGFIGSMNKYSLLVSATEHVAVSTDERIPLWAPSNLPVPAEASSFHKIIGYFRYNNKNFWITMESRTGIHLKISLYHSNISTTDDTPTSYDDAGYFATLTRTDILTFVAADIDFNKQEFCNFFLNRDRLWVIMSTGAYFSKATDPTVFAVPNGGFFKFPDQSINYGMALRETVYILCDNSINAITYSTDPNLDSTVRPLSNTLGGDHGCIYQDTPIVINQLGIFQINSNSIDKLLDNEFDVGEDVYNHKINAFEDYLIINKFNKVNYEKFDVDSTETRTNLVKNPSFTTDLADWAVSTLYMERTRINTDHYAGSSNVWSCKVRKINDQTDVTRQNLINNPSATDTVTLSWALSQNQSGLPVGEPNDAHNDGEVDFRLSFGASIKAFRVDASIPATVSGLQDQEHNCFVESNMFAVTAGHNYRIRYRFRHGGESGYSTFSFQIKWRDGGGAVLSTDTYTPPQGAKDVFATKGPYTGFDAPVGATQATINVWIQTIIPAVDRPRALVFTADWDDFLFEDEADLSIYETIAGDGYFSGDTADTAQYLYQWAGAANNSISQRLGNDGTLAQAKELVSHTTKLPVTAGTSYVLGAAFKAIDSAHTISARIRYYDAGAALLSTVTASMGDSVVGAWAFLTTTFTPPVNATQIDFAFETDEALAYLDEYYVDAVILEKNSSYQSYFDGDTVDTTTTNYAWTGVANASTSTATISAFLRRLYSNGSQFTPFEGGNSLGYNVYFVNLVNGAVHVFDYTDYRNASDRGYIVDVFVNVNKDATGNYNCFFLTNKFVSEDAGSYTYKGNTYYISSFVDNDFYDFAADNTDILRKYSPKIDVEIDSYMPDENEFYVKKMRSIEAMGKFPLSDFGIKFGFDNEVFTSLVDLHADSYYSRPHYPFRVAINQRCRSLSLRFMNTGSDVPLAEDFDYGILEISQLHLLWTPTGVAPRVSR